MFFIKRKCMTVRLHKTANATAEIKLSTEEEEEEKEQLLGRVFSLWESCVKKFPTSSLWSEKVLFVFETVELQTKPQTATTTTTKIFLQQLTGHCWNIVTFAAGFVSDIIYVLCNYQRCLESEINIFF